MSGLVQGSNDWWREVAATSAEIAGELVARAWRGSDDPEADVIAFSDPDEQGFDLSDYTTACARAGEYLMTGPQGLSIRASEEQVHWWWIITRTAQLILGGVRDGWDAAHQAMSEALVR